MGFNFNNRRIQKFIDDVRNFKTNLIQFDVDRVKREATRQFAVEMTKMVIKTLKSHPDINAPATTGPYESGPGPSIASREAWIVKKDSRGAYSVQPHPEVRQRAVVLNDGLGRIEPTGDGPLRWYVNGVPRFAEFIPADKTHNETRYWQTAFNSLVQSGKMEDIGVTELEAEADRAFNKRTTVVDYEDIYE